MEPGVTVTPHNLRIHAEELKSILGDQLFNTLLNGFYPAQRKSNTNAARHHASAHPFAAAWYDLCLGIQQSEHQGSLQLSEESIFLLALVYSLSLAKNDPESKNVFSKLTGKKQYYSTVFELFTFAGYRALNQSVAFIPASPQTGEKRADLRVVTRSARTVHIECKSLLDDIRREGLVWTEVQLRVTRILEKMNRPEICGGSNF